MTEQAWGPTMEQLEALAKAKSSVKEALNLAKDLLSAVTPELAEQIRHYTVFRAHLQDVHVSALKRFGYSHDEAIKMMLSDQELAKEQAAQLVKFLDKTTSRSSPLGK